MGSFVQRRGINRLLKIVYKEGSLQGFYKNGVQGCFFGDYPRVKDSWMDVIASQGSSLLSADLSGSAVTDTGLGCLKDCTNLEALTFNYCDRISECGLKYISGLTNLTSLSLRKSNIITAAGMHVFFQLSKLGKVRHGEMIGDSGWMRIKGLMKLESLNIRCC